MKRLLVVGDIMLDVYYKGVVKRISPEAPVPVLNVEYIERKLGGAANVANNCSHLGMEVSLAGIIGSDDNGKKIYNLLAENNIDASLVISDNNKTITKTRIVSSGQQIVRIDENDRVFISEKLTDEMLLKMKNRIQQCDVVIISDYLKGFCTDKICKELISFASSQNKIVIVDPKGMEWMKYEGANIITPNFKEINEYMGGGLCNTDSSIERNCCMFYQSIAIDHLIITRSEKGITHIDKNGNVKHYRSDAKEVYDVSGAGDTVIAALATYLNNDNFSEAIRISNIAAGIVVAKRGTAVVELNELNEEIRKRKKGNIAYKIRSIEEIFGVVSEWKKNGETIAFTNGCYDVFHRGHAYSILAASEFAEHLIVAINSDRTVKKLKGNSRPVNAEYDRAYVVASLSCVDMVFIFDEETPLEVIRKIHPDVLVKGSDYKIEEVVGREYAGRVELVDYVLGYSSTEIIEKWNT